MLTIHHITLVQKQSPSKKDTKMDGFKKVLFDYETPKVVTIRSVSLGIVRLLMQTACIGFVVLYQLWYSRGYQEFFTLQEKCVMIKIKGSST